MRHILFILALVLSSVSVSAQNYSDEEHVDFIETYFGRVLEREQHKDLYGVFVDPPDEKTPSIVDTLGRTVAKMNEKKGVAVNKFYIVDSVEPITVIKSEQETGSQAILSSIFISTAEIQRVFGLNSSSQNLANLSTEQYQKGVRVLTGLLAMKFVDPVAKLGSGHLAGSVNHRVNSIADILSLDVEATELVEKSGMPMQLVYEALQYIKTHSQFSETVSLKSSAKEADIDLRLSALETYLTARRYQVGVSQNSWDTAKVPNLQQIDEALALDYKGREDYFLPVVPQGNFETVAQELLEHSRYYEKNRKTSEVETETKTFFYRAGLKANILYSALLKKLSDDPTAENFALFTTTVEEIMPTRQDSTSLFWEPAYIDQVLAEVSVNPSQEVVSPFSIVREDPFFSSPMMVDWVTENMGGFFNQDRILLKLPSALIPADLFVELAFKHLNVQARRTEKGKQSLFNILGFSSYYTGIGSLSMVIHVIDRYWKKFYRGLDDDQLTDFILELAFDPPDGVIPKTAGLAVRNKFGLVEVTRDLEVKRLEALAAEGDLDAVRKVKNYDEFMALIWENRDVFAFFEVFNAHSNSQPYVGVKQPIVTDWSYIAERVGVPEQEADLMIWESFKKLVSGEAPERLAFLKEALKNTSEYKDNTFLNVKRGVNTPVEFFENVLPWFKNDHEVDLLSFYHQVKSDIDTAVALVNYDINSNPQKYLDRFSEKFLQELEGIAQKQIISREFIDDLHVRVKEGLFNSPETVRWDFNKEVIHHELVLKSNLSEKQKKDWLRELFFTDGDVDKKLDLFRIDMEDWKSKFFSRSKERNAALLKDLSSLGVIPNILDFLLEMQEYARLPFGHSAYMIANRAYFNLLGSASSLLVGEILSLKSGELNLEKLDKILGSLEHPNSKSAEKLYNSGIVKIKNALVNQYETAFASEVGELDFFKKITGSSATPDTDAFFTSHFLDDDQNLKKVSAADLQQFLEEGRFKNKDLKILLTRVVIKNEVKRLQDLNVIPADDLWKLFKMVNVLNPDPSLKKDELLEDLGWKLRLTEEYLETFVEEPKSSNVFRPKNMQLAKWASVLNGALRELSPEIKWDLISYIQNPIEHSNVAEALEVELRKLPIQEFKTLSEYMSIAFERDKENQAAKNEAIRYVLGELEQFSLESGEYEKAFLMNNVFKSGDDPIYEDVDFMDKVSSKLGYTKDSKEDVALRVFLEKTIPKEEIGVSVGYLLASINEGETNFAELFKIFQTIGIKFGQTASIWGLLDEEVNEQTKKLKDNAGALSKKQIENILKQEYPNQNIKLLKVLGSASIKSVVLVELPNGETSVLLVRNPHILNQIANNLASSKRFLKGLEEAGVHEGSVFFNMVVEALEAQIYREVDFRNEMESLRELKPIFEKISTGINGQNNPFWKSVVLVEPDMSMDYKENTAFVSEARGVTFDKLKGKAKEDAGVFAVEMSLELFFKYGYFEPDRHKGNFLFHEETKEIYFFDVGQVEKYKVNLGWDDRLTIIEMMKSLIGKNSETFIEMSLKISEEGTVLSAEDKVLLKVKLDQIFSENGADLEVVLREAVKTLAESGVKLKHNYVFGILKGFMTLYGEQYVSSKKFFSIMEEQAKSLYLKKSYFPAVIPQVVRGLWDAFISKRSSETGVAAPIVNPGSAMSCGKFL